MQPRVLNGILTWPLFVVFVVVILFVITGAVSFYKSLEQKTIVATQDELSVLTALKIEEIAKWRMEHIRDGDLINQNAFLLTHVAAFLKDDEQPELKADLLGWMESFISNYDYHSIFLLDSVRTIMLSYPEEDSLTGNSLLTPAPNVEDFRKIYFSDLHSSPDLEMPHLDLIIPFIYPEDKNKVIGTVVMRIDPGKMLFPLIHSWPEPSSSSEMMLVRRDGDSVIYLNDLRFIENATLKLKLPLSNTTLPSSKGVLGYEGLFIGKDYRNVEVFSFIRKVPGSVWFLIAKSDKREIYKPLNNQLIFISIIVALLILSLTATMGYFLKSQRSRVFRELNVTKDKFFSIISHDLKSPFTSIIGFSDLLIHKTRKKELEAIEQYACAINSSSQRAMDLLNNLAEWAGVQSGRTEFRPEDIDISNLVDNVTELLNISAMQKSIKIIRQTPPNLVVRADRTMISTVLRNLVSNAIKFSYRNSTITISADRIRKGVKVEVRDYGTGMRGEMAESIFQPGGPLTTPGTNKERGTGLGLILCKEFIQLHKGRIWAESSEGKGSSFFFILPDKGSRRPGKSFFRPAGQ